MDWNRPSAIAVAVETRAVRVLRRRRGGQAASGRPCQAFSNNVRTPSAVTGAGLAYSCSATVAATESSAAAGSPSSWRDLGAPSVPISS